MKNLTEEIEDYFNVGKKTIFFLPEFEGVVSIRPRQITTFASSTSSNKSTLTTNLAIKTFSQKNKDGKNKSVLVITNEEHALDVYCKVFCLMNGWNYADHANFSPQHISKFQQFIHGITKTGLLQVIDDGHGGVSGNTSTIEGFKSIFQRLVDRNIKYDLIIIDCFQNISKSTLNPRAKYWEVQANFARFLDQNKASIKTPIVVLTKVHKPDNNYRQKDYVESRMIGAKKLIQVSSEFVEILPNFKTAEWRVHKSRTHGSNGQSVFTGFNSGEIFSLTKKKVPFQDII